METKKRKKIFNIIMVVLILVIAACGIMTAGSIKGWFGDDSAEAMLKSGKLTGITNIERNGVGYTLEENVSLKAGDIIETKAGAQADILIGGKNTLTMNESTDIAIDSAADGEMKLTVKRGEIFVDMPDAAGKCDIDFGENTAHITGTVFSISAREGSGILNVYEGSVKVDAADGSSRDVGTGEGISTAVSGKGSTDVKVIKLKATTLNDFLIGKIEGYGGKGKLCFTSKQMKKVREARAAEAKKAEKAALESDNKVTASSSQGSSEGVSTPSGKNADKTSGKTSSKASGKTSGNDGSGKKTDATEPERSVKSCTISIRCETILDNMENLTSGKEKYVPSNGVILSPSTVEFKDGETVFDVLKRVCSAAGIQLEYSWTPMYDSYYIEGINQLYEFDCGNESGWMYKVNGWFPNYGCSSYNLKNGDNIVWVYTCNGLGADVGGSVF